METIQGVVYEVIYRNEGNGYTVMDLECDGTLITVVGFFASVREGEMLKLCGEWTNHKDYGEQFKAETYESTAPASLVGMERYLGSGIIEGIGPSTAKKLVEHFGLDTIDVISYHPQRLREIEGIGAKKAEKIHEAFEAQKEMKDIMIFLEEYGVSPSYAIRIYKEYGGETIQKIKENPYRLAEDVSGIGFRMADRIAMAMGYASNSDFRLESGLLFTISSSYGNGHTYLPKDVLLEKAAEILSVNHSELENSLMNLFLKRKVVTDKIIEKDGGTVDAVYANPMYAAEVGVARKLLRLSHTSPGKIPVDLAAAEEVPLAARQKEAVEAALEHGVVVVTGGPGTGKTTIIKTILRLFAQNDCDVMLAAPTGRATKRMQEATGMEAKTIHRLLEYGSGVEEQGEAFFQKNDEAPLECDAVIVDEASMIDILLMYHLLQAVSEGTRLILVGDADQLPSVGPGNVLRDIIASDTVKVVELDEIFRQAEESLIVVNAHRINHGELPNIRRKDRDFFFLREENPQKLAELICSLCTTRLKKYTGYDAFSGIQVLSPMKKGECGVLHLNQCLQQVLNPPGAEKKEKLFRDTIFRERDKVMQIKNDYKLKWRSATDLEKGGEGVFNGDMGIILELDGDSQVMTVLFDGERLVEYEYANLDELELAYALTVHKSQGSEFPVVVMPVSYGPPMLLTRNLLYTALTRAKSMVVLVGHERYLKQMVENNYISRRYSALEYRLRKLKETYVPVGE